VKNQDRKEVEIKLRVGSVEQAKRLLRTAGFKVSKRRIFESNTVFDTSSLELRASSRLLRLRQSGNAHILTFKGTPTAGRHKTREEIETSLGDAEALREILARLGFKVVFRYEKYRTEFRRPDEAGLATLDETPIGVFLELEGSPTWIDRAARLLGFSESDYLTESYGGLFLQWCSKKGIKSDRMVF